MKKITKRLISCVLAALLILTSVPFTALAADADLELIKSAISEYESKMDGTVYNNMKNAYDKYVTAKEAAYAYEYGHDTSIDVAAAANALSDATAQMTKWTKAEITSPTFTYGSKVPADYVKGVVYASTPTVLSGFQKEKWNVAFLMPKNVVFLYDGSDLRLPIMVGGNNQGQWSGTDKSFCAVWPTASATSSNDDNKYFQFNQVWNGSYDINTSSNDNPLSASEFNWNNTYITENQTNQNDSLKGYNNDTQAQTNADYRSQKIVCNKVNENHKKLWRQYANYIQYASGAENLEWNNGLQTAKLYWGVKSWESNFGNKFYFGYYDPDVTFYVIDYRGVADAVSGISSQINMGYSGGAATKFYTQRQLDDLLETVEALQADPATGYTNSNFATKAASVAASIKTNIAALGNISVSENDMSSYDALAAAIAKSKATYDYNNADGVYTADSFAAFKTAYEASEAEALDVLVKGFTTATTASALETAYKNLNTVTPASGTSGDTTFDFNEETGEVTVNGEGAMADYESGADSPFGNNDVVKDVTIGDDVTYVGAHAFDGASELETITVPASATYGEGAFDNCPKLKTVIITGGAVENKSADNAPWKAPKVRTVKLGENEGDLSISSIGDDVFEDNKNTVYYFYNKETQIPNTSGAILGTNPTIYGYIPSTAYDYAKKFNLTFVELSHEHVWDKGTVTEPTCTKGGFTTFKCLFCDETREDNYTAPLGHDWDEGEVIAPTCTERGYTIKTCQRAGCGETKIGSYTKAAGHKYDGEITAAYATGEVKQDIQYKHNIECSVCHEASKSDYCSFKVKGYKEDLGQSYIEFECSVCGGTYLYKSDSVTGEHMVFFFGADNSLLLTTRIADGEKVTEVPDYPDQKVGHIYSWTVDDVEVNPEEQIIYSDTIFKIKDEFVQYDVTYVDADGAIIDSEKVNHGETPADIPALNETAINRADDGHDVYLWDNDPNGAVITEDTTFTQVLRLVPHDFIDDIHKEATCSEDGSMSRYCETCGYTVENEIIPATKNHNYIELSSKAPTCTANGEKKYQCTVCSDTYTETIKATGHKWNSGVITKYPTVEETGIKTYTCTLCKATKTEILPKANVADVTPSKAEADKAPVNKAIKKPAGIKTVANSKKKQLIISFDKVPGAQNYRVMYRKQGAKKWTYAWTNGKNKYTLKKLKNKGLYEFKFSAYTKNAKGAWERGDYSKTSYRYYYKEKLKKVTPSKGKIKVTWAKDKNATYYQLFYSKKKNMSGAKKIEIKSNKTTAYTISGLKKGKYYVRIRAIKKVNGKKYVSEYSTRKPAKVK